MSVNEGRVLGLLLKTTGERGEKGRENRYEVRAGKELSCRVGKWL